MTMASKALDHDAAAHFDGRGHAELVTGNLGRETDRIQKRLELPRAGSAEQQRHLDAIRRHRGHHRALDITPGGTVDQPCRALLGAGRGRVEIEKPGALIDRCRTGLCDRHGLARGDGGDDEVGFRGQLGVRGRKSDSEFRRMLLQRHTLLAAELDVVG
ncbi:hypothetical protein ABIE73_005925 [Bradyrhizobium yuanmingense]